MRIPRQVAALTIAVVLAVASLAVGRPDEALAGPESDIPGIPLPGPVVTGQLGGPIYDVVYRIDVAPESVIVIGLEGTAGTDFDLYLFDSSATSVLSTAGLLLKSIGPTSSESLSLPTLFGGTYYVDLNGATDVQGTYTLTVAVVPDATPPDLTVVIAGGASQTNTAAVTVTLAAFDDLSGVTEMSLSVDGVIYLPWEPFRNQFPWTLSGSDGVRGIWARVRNGVGLVSRTAADTIVLDTRPPELESVDPVQGATVTDPRPSIRVRFDEPIDAGSWTSGGLVMQAPTGAIVSGAFTYDAGTRTGTFRPASDLATGYQYILTVSRVRDLAGNEIAATGSWTLKSLIGTSVTVAAAPSVLVWGGSTTLSGTAKLPAGATLELAAREGAVSEFSSVDVISPAAGSYSRTLQPAMNTWYRVSYAGTPTVAESSASVRVLVRRKIALVGLSSSVVRSGVAGRSIALIAAASPARAGLSISFQLYRWDAARARYVYGGSFGRSSDAAGRARLDWTPKAGRWAWRVAVAPDAEFANNLSASYRWSISR